MNILNKSYADSKACHKYLYTEPMWDINKVQFHGRKRILERLLSRTSISNIIEISSFGDYE
jgi:hypothetical protein